MTGTTPDVFTTYSNAFVYLEPLSPDVEQWLKSNVDFGPYQEIGEGIAIDPDYAPDIIVALVKSGYTVQDTRTGNFAIIV